MFHSYFANPDNQNRLKRINVYLLYSSRRLPLRCHFSKSCKACPRVALSSHALCPSSLSAEKSDEQRASLALRAMSPAWRSTQTRVSNQTKNLKFSTSTDNQILCQRRGRARAYTLGADDQDCVTIIVFCLVCVGLSTFVCTMQNCPQDTESI